MSKHKVMLCKTYKFHNQNFYLKQAKNQLDEFHLTSTYIISSISFSPATRTQTHLIAVGRHKIILNDVHLVDHLKEENGRRQDHFRNEH